MTVEKLKENFDNFPVGMRVLAVDDDPICLKLLDTLLRKCQYHVTTTSQARMALKMLRENRERFDLVISDVHMPDMDGFKLLELVGLEMDLPVIMLSANSDPKLVMKGVTHGACDYLVKPIRIEELRNIWQHVIRKKKFVPKNQNKSSNDQVKPNQANGEGSPTADNSDQNGKTNRKRKEDEDDSEDGNESEENGTQKRPRVVWSIELHRKFVASVNQLGIEKAVPKRILDLMNVEGLTRENVASHLQKYRLYLKRISSVATQQANMAAALGVKDSPFMRIGPFEGIGDFRNLSGPGRQLAHYTANGMFGRLNSPANVNLQNLAPTAFIQPGQNIGKMHPAIFNQNPNLFQGIPSSFELDHFQQQNNKGGAIGGPSNTTISLHGNYQQPMANGMFANNQASNNVASFNSDPFTIEPSAMQPNAFHCQLPIDISTSSTMTLPLDKSGNLFKEKGDIAMSGRLGEGSDHATESRGRAEDSFLLEQPKLQGGFASRGFDSFDDMVMNSMIKREHDETVPSCDFGLHSYSFGQGGT